MKSSLGCSHTFTCVDSIADEYYQVLSDLLEEHAPKKERLITIRPETPWYRKEINDLKKLQRKAEKTWRKSKLTIHEDLYIAACDSVSDCIIESKQDHYRALIHDAKDQKSLFKVLTNLTSSQGSKPLSSHSSSKELACKFGH